MWMCSCLVACLKVNDGVEGDGDMPLHFIAYAKTCMTCFQLQNFFFFCCYYLKFDLLVQDAGVEVDPMGDLNTEAERKLGQIVLEK